jgi:tetratricopeptide (TPR) repeat protein
VRFGARIARVLALAPLLAACQSPQRPDPAPTAASPDDQQARLLLEAGRALRAEGRPDASERVLRRGLALAPESARLERALAHALEAQGRRDEAQAARARADALDPPAPPLPEEPLPGRGSGLRVALLPREDPDRPAALPAWPEPAIARVLATRIATRLPAASFGRTDPRSAASAREWLDLEGARAVLSLRLERAWCGFTVKDGRFAIAELRALALRRGQPTAATPRRFRGLVTDPLGEEDCRPEAIARALESVLAAHPELAGAASERGAGDAWPPSAMRVLFPGIESEVIEALRVGRARLAAGELGAARDAFERAVAIDPSDALARSHLEDARRSIALARELAGDGEGEAIDPQLSAAQRAAAEAALDREQERRQELLAALAVLDEDLHSPEPETLARLRPVEIREREAFGPRLAHERSQADVEARAAYAPDGSELARYYFVGGSPEPLMREEDTDGDGRSDRWITYRGSARSEIFEDGTGLGRPDLRLSFAEGGAPLQRVEFDPDGDGDPERVFVYHEGALQAESRDTDGDGVLDRFDQLDAQGRLGVREEDIDGDGAIDVRSVYRGGKLVRRVISDPQHLPES